MISEIKYKTYKPDIVGENGIKAIKRIRSGYLICGEKTVIFKGFSDLEYARGSSELDFLEQDGTIFEDWRQQIENEIQRLVSDSHKHDLSPKPDLVGLQKLLSK